MSLRSRLSKLERDNPPPGSLPPDMTPVERAAKIRDIFSAALVRSGRPPLGPAPTDREGAIAYLTEVRERLLPIIERRRAELGLPPSRLTAWGGQS